MCDLKIITNFVDLGENSINMINNYSLKQHASLHTTEFASHKDEHKVMTPASNVTITKPMTREMVAIKQVNVH